jgi:pyruvate/2-oxoglutarate/acetoin dehydrogenase E1 component
MPATPQDARDLLIASVLCDDPVLYIDDRWLYQVEQDVTPIVELDLSRQGPQLLRCGTDCTLVGASFSTELCLRAAGELADMGISCDVVDLRVINPLHFDEIVRSVRRTGRLCVVDGGWRSCGLAGEIIAGVAERIPPAMLRSSPVRLTLPDAPAPTSKALEDIYYTNPADIVQAVEKRMRGESKD